MKGIVMTKYKTLPIQAKPIIRHLAQTQTINTFSISRANAKNRRVVAQNFAVTATPTQWAAAVAKYNHCKNRCQGCMNYSCVNLCLNNRYYCDPGELPPF